MSGRAIVWIAGGVLALGMVGPSAAHKLGELAATGGSDAAKGAAAAAAGSAGGLCAPGGLDHLCAMPIDPAGDAANLARAQAARDAARTVPTTVPSPEPYGPANGKVHPLPSVTDAQPEASGRASLPRIGETATGGPLGGLIAELPAIGPALSQGLKALPSAGAP